MKNTLIAVVAIVLIAIGAFYYYSQKTAPTGTAQVTSNDMVPTDAGNPIPPGSSMETGTVDVSAIGTVATSSEKDISVKAFNYGFSPSTISVKKGDHVKITVTNTGGMHDFKIDELTVATPRIETGQSAVVEFDATKAGSFQFYCSVGNHRAMGMWGTLTVTQ